MACLWVLAVPKWDTSSALQMGILVRGAVQCGYMPSSLGGPQMGHFPGVPDGDFGVWRGSILGPLQLLVCQSANLVFVAKRRTNVMIFDDLAILWGGVFAFGSWRSPNGTRILCSKWGFWCAKRLNAGTCLRVLAVPK